MPPLDPKREPLNPDRRLILTPSMIPNSSNFDAKDSRYFKKFTNLPSPEEVRKKTKAQQLAGTSVDKRRTLYESDIQRRAPVTVFQELSLLVKWGTAMTISEGQCLYGIGLLLKDYVPVPELYGWRQDGGETFLYMEYLDAQTLEQAWDSLGSDDRVSISGELRIICANLRHLEQDPEDPFIGRVFEKLSVILSLQCLTLCRIQGTFSGLLSMIELFTQIQCPKQGRSAQSRSFMIGSLGSHENQCPIHLSSQSNLNAMTCRMTRPSFLRMVTFIAATFSSRAPSRIALLQLSIGSNQAGCLRTGRPERHNGPY